MIITRREAFKIAAAAGASAFGLPLAVTDARAAATVASAADAAAVSVPEAAVASAVDIDDLVARMTLDEKISMVHGIAEGHDIGHTPGVPRLGVPPLRLTDGPCGLRVGPPPTCLPCPAALGATWSRTLSRQFGEVLGREAKYDGQNVMFAPAMNIVRVPQGGRSFEYISEDAYLTGQIVAPVIIGIQSLGVIACAKHYVCNDQEHDRNTVDVHVGTRALREVYLAPFEEAVATGGAWSVMAAHNLVNGVHCSQSQALLKTLLKGTLGFKGFVVTDWGALHDMLGGASGGLDLEMPTGIYFGDTLRQAVLGGRVAVSVLNDKVRRILAALQAMGKLDGIDLGGPGAINSPAHRQVAYDVAVESTVLLKNSGPILPLKDSAISSIAVLGRFGADPRIGGGGSSRVLPAVISSPLEAIKKLLPSGTTVRYEAGATTGETVVVPNSVLTPPGGAAGQHGLLAQMFPRADLSGSPSPTWVDPYVDRWWGALAAAPGLPVDNFSIRWTGTLTAPVTGAYRFKTNGSLARLYLHGKLVLDHWLSGTGNTATTNLTAGAHSVRLEMHAGTGDSSMTWSWVVPGSPEASASTALDRAVAAAKSSDVAVVFVSDIEREDGDRTSLLLPGNQDDLISRVAAVNPKTVVVLQTGAAVLTGSWLGQVPAVLETWYPGQAAGAAVAAVLFGAAEPGGRLPVTMAKAARDYPCTTAAQYPGVDDVETYSEAVFVGYRHFDSKQITPEFPFGHGLGYTTMSYERLFVTKVADYTLDVEVTVRNTGSRVGKEVVQVYLTSPTAPVTMPPQQLRGFTTLRLAPGARGTAMIGLTPRAFSYFDASPGRWQTVPGKWTVKVGRSSRNIAMSTTVLVP